MSSKGGPLRYVGDGAFLIGVPARDLTAEEAAQVAEIIAGSPLYEPVEEPEPPAEAEAAEGAGAGQASKKRGKGE